MGERTSHAPGTFSWTDLSTTDPDGAKRFYAELFGWDYDDQPIPQGGVYSMARKEGKDVAAVFQAQEGMPTAWTSYVTVESADSAATRANDVGGTLMAEPFDVMDVGRMSVIADPTGAALCLWEARSHIGASLVNTPGSMTWNDLATPDPAAAADFYQALFGWSVEEIPDAGGYRVIRNGGRTNGGMAPLDPARMGAGTPPNWTPYFGHADVGRLVGEVGGLGGRVLAEPMQMPQGAFAVLSDPQGAVFAVWTGEYDPD
jgi:predicted enzyme related to lactoylglutathione lyase